MTTDNKLFLLLKRATAKRTRYYSTGISQETDYMEELFPIKAAFLFPFIIRYFPSFLSQIQQFEDHCPKTVMKILGNKSGNGM